MWEWAWLLFTLPLFFYSRRNRTSLFLWISTRAYSVEWKCRAISGQRQCCDQHLPFQRCWENVVRNSRRIPCLWIWQLWRSYCNGSWFETNLPHSLFLGWRSDLGLRDHQQWRYHRREHNDRAISFQLEICGHWLQAERKSRRSANPSRLHTNAWTSV